MDFKDLKGTYIIEIAEMEPSNDLGQEEERLVIESLTELVKEEIDPEEEEQ